MHGCFAHKSVIKNRACIFRESVVLNEGGRCLEPGFTGFWFGGLLLFRMYALSWTRIYRIKRIYRILVWGCSVFLDVHAVLKQDLQDWKGFTGFWFGGVLLFRMYAMSWTRIYRIGKDFQDSDLGVFCGFGCTRCLEPGFTGLKGFSGFWLGGVLLFRIYLAISFCTHYFLNATDGPPR